MFYCMDDVFLNNNLNKYTERELLIGSSCISSISIFTDIREGVSLALLV